MLSSGEATHKPINYTRPNKYLVPVNNLRKTKQNHLENKVLRIGRAVGWQVRRELEPKRWTSNDGTLSRPVSPKLLT